MTSFAASWSHSAGGLPRDYAAPSVFEPDALIREACRQKRILVANVPRVCVLDPDGDIVRHLSRAGRTRLVPQWPCYHSRMVETDLDGHSVGIVDCAVGAPYAVLVAEQMFALGCELLLSITSSGQVAPLGPTPYFVLIDRALRDEGTSHHYAPPAEFADADATLVPTAEHALAATGFRVHRGATWTTDAPFRETSAAIAAARAKGILAVEMEAAALYAFSADLLCRPGSSLYRGENPATLRKPDGCKERKPAAFRHERRALVHHKRENGRGGETGHICRRPLRLRNTKKTPPARCPRFARVSRR